ncbi:MAG TPA: sigma-70 family RNA polymerase sigma factor [Pyrinomonadaceae bacterium]|jgi:RNA polymerase sigma factor (sigma-70 family)
MPKPRAISPAASHEEIFAQRYRWLMGWALRLTNHDREQAEDLVHDTFVQFMISRPDLGAIGNNIEGYLYAMLRNMHVSQVRRALRIRETAFPIDDILSISETASVQTELRMAGQRIQIQDELCRICQYASIRKNSSKIGSAVILRFFHGYYPYEIASVTHSSRANVDKMLQRARTEARLYLKDPESLGFLGTEQPMPDLQMKFGQEPEDFLSELRDALYASRRGDCLSSEQLRDAYQTNETDCVSPQLLAHIVCCAVCLDEVNRLLGLPLLAAREPEKMTGRDKRDRDKGSGGPGGSGDGTGSAGDFMDKPRRRLKDVLEHRPKELRISVNGFILGAHTINSALNKLSISAKGEEKIGFVEVFSEEEVRLLFCLVDAPPDGPVERKVRADLSDDRSLELFLDFSDSWPNLNVTYHDPAFAAETAVEVQSPKSKVQSPSVEGAAVLDADLPVEKRRAFLTLPRRLWFALKRWADFGHWTLDFGLLLRPGTVTAAFALLLIAALVLVQLRQTPPVTTSAADLLERSATAEAALAARTDQVLHRTIRLEEKSASGRLVSSRRIETWHSAEKGITARRLYDENGSLIAGDWRRADGVQTIYHHGARPRLQIGNPQSAIRNFEDVWQVDPTAKEFSSLIGGAQNAQAQATDNNYLISYGNSNMAAPGLMKASLVFGRSDLHAVEQTLVVRQGDEIREYRFIETSFERRSPGSVAPAVFEPEPALINGDGATGKRGEEETIPASPNPAPPSPALATPELELQVLKQLNQADAFYGEQISLTRTPEGRLRIQGIVDTDKRKTEILQSLSSLKRNPAVQIQVETAAEAVGRQARQRATSSGSTQIGSVEGNAKSPIPAAPELRAYFSRQGIAGEALDDEVRRFADRVMGRTRQARRHALALNQIAQRFSADDLQALDGESRNQWRAMIGQHARAIQQELEALRRELQPMFPSVSSEEGDAGIEIAGDADFVRAGKRLYELTSAVEDAVGRSFSIYAGGNASAPVKTSQFSRSLRSATRLAGAVARP